MSLVLVNGCRDRSLEWGFDVKGGGIVRGFWVKGLGLRYIGFRVQGKGFRVKDLGFRVKDLGFRVEG